MSPTSFQTAPPRDINYRKWGLQGSNLWPSACKADALPAELRPQIQHIMRYEWKEVDSNHRSIKQQIYSLSPLATRESFHFIKFALPTSKTSFPPSIASQYKKNFEICLLQASLLRQIKIFLQCSRADIRTRTENLLITNQLLCQLSHIGILHLLSVRPRRDSNPWPPPWKGGALTNWATGPWNFI